MSMWEVHIGSFQRPMVVLTRAEDEEHARATVEMQFASWFERRITVWFVKECDPASYGEVA